MAQTFRMATSSVIDEYVSIGEKSKVTEELFYQQLYSKVKEVTQKQPERFDEVLQNVTTHLQKRLSLTIKDTWFEIKGKA